MTRRFCNFAFLVSLLLGHGLLAKTIFVDDNASAGGDGSSWATAHKYLQDALAVAESGDEVWVAEGTYKPDQGVGQVAGNREASFTINKDIDLIGGFLGSESSSDPLGRPDYTVLSGEINTDHTYWSLNTVTVGSVSGKMSNFSIKHGNNNSNNWSVTGMFGGGGLLFKGQGFVISKCIFSENPSRMYIEGDASNSFVDCVFSNTVAVKGQVKFLNCIFISNSNFKSSGVNLSQSHELAYEGQLTFRNCTITCPIKQSWGDDRLIMINSIFGGIQYNGIKETQRVNGEILGPFKNRITILEAIPERYPGDPNSREGILHAPNSTSGFENISGYDYYIEYDVLFSYSKLNFLDYGNPVGKDNIWFTNDDGFRLVENSTVLDRGSTPHLFDTYEQYTSFVNSGSVGLTDITGRNRVNGNSVDIGAYEYYFIPQYNVSEINSSKGTITGGGQYYSDTEATLQANPSSGYTFLKWIGDLDSSSNPVKVPVTKNLIVSAKFISTTIFKLAQEAKSLGSDWYANAWFGTFFASDSSWIYHSELGWLYVHPMEDSSYWMWSSEYGWLWITSDYFPYIYQNSSSNQKYANGSWLYLNESNGELLRYDNQNSKWLDANPLVRMNILFDDQYYYEDFQQIGSEGNAVLSQDLNSFGYDFAGWYVGDQIVSEDINATIYLEQDSDVIGKWQMKDLVQVTINVPNADKQGYMPKMQIVNEDGNLSWVEFEVRYVVDCIDFKNTSYHSIWVEDFNSSSNLSSLKTEFSFRYPKNENLKISFLNEIKQLVELDEWKIFYNSSATGEPSVITSLFGFHRDLDILVESDLYLIAETTSVLYELNNADNNETGSELDGGVLEAVPADILNGSGQHSDPSHPCYCPDPLLDCLCAKDDGPNIDP